MSKPDRAMPAAVAVPIKRLPAAAARRWVTSGVDPATVSDDHLDRAEDVTIGDIGAPIEGPESIRVVVAGSAAAERDRLTPVIPEGSPRGGSSAVGG